MGKNIKLLYVSTITFITELVAKTIVKINFYKGSIMYKIRKIIFNNHPVLGNLTLDFCNQDNKAVDTVIFAGENGTGKSSILNELYNIATYSNSCEQEVEFEIDNENITISFYYHTLRNGKSVMYAKDGKGMNALLQSGDYKHKYSFSAIFSDVDINFHSKQVSSVTSSVLDEKNESRRSSMDLPTQINQLIIDIQAIDDSAISLEVHKPENADLKVSELSAIERMPRFTRAFNKIFSGLTYSHIENKGNYKSIVFTKSGKMIPIEKLSSGEKQIVYRGCFLLKDINALKGAFVFIDEPEISLHPVWQEKIMDYYKGIFTDKNGIQTSQIFVATHSPFIIHNENRINDKVIVLARDIDGNIVVKDKQEYFKCTSVEAVQDAFYIHNFSSNQPTVYLEGRTDEKYFNKALEVFNIQVPFQFKWIGYIGENGQEENSGKDALNKAIPFLIAKNLTFKNVCLYDCDTHKPKKCVNNVVSLSIPQYENSKNITMGIENALEFGDFNLEPYKKYKISTEGYGMEKRIPDFQKMDCCNAICLLEKERLEKIFIHLKEVIEMLISVFNEK